MTSIEWTDRTWNPVRGCSRVSEGCRNCYAERMAARFAGPGEPFHGFAKVVAPRDALDRVGVRRNGWTGRVELIPEKLEEPLHWRKPARVFVNSMSDLFHEALSFHDIAAVYGVMAYSPHTFQVLTKRPERRRAFLRWMGVLTGPRDAHGNQPLANMATDPVMGAVMAAGARGVRLGSRTPSEPAWPLPNVWEGVSVEDQATADARIPLLLQTPAAKRFISYEPALGPLEMLPSWLAGYDYSGGLKHSAPRLDWVIVGGESGRGARWFDVAWARSVVAQCREAGVSVFVKQLGARVECDLSEANTSWFLGTLLGHTITSQTAYVRLKHPKGADPAEWPEDLRVREWPA